MKTIYTEEQIKRAKIKFNNFCIYRDIEFFEPEHIGYREAEQRWEFHNNIVSKIKNGNEEVIREWKLFFLNEELKKDAKLEKSKLKKSLNKTISKDILAPVKEMKKLVEFGRWLNTVGNIYRKQHFSKKYTKEAVEAFLNHICA